MKTTTRFILVLVLALSTLTACGNKTTSASSAASNEFFEGEGEITGGIKSEEEIAALQEEEAEAYAEAEEETITAADLEDVDLTEDSNSTDGLDDSSQSTPNYTGSGSYVDPADFWEGDDYFDLVGYLYANGADDVYMMDYYEGRTDTDPDCYEAWFHDFTWKIMIYRDVGPALVADGHSVFGTFPKDIERQNSGNAPQISVDHHGMTMRDFGIELLYEVMDVIRTNPNPDDPFNNGGMPLN